MEMCAHLIKDITLINQISGLTAKNGRIDHGEGGNDDSVMAYLQACNWILFGNNLDMYTFSGGDLSNILSEVKVVAEDGTLRNAADPEDFEYLKAQISLLEKKIKGANNPTIKIEMIHKLNSLKKKLPSESENILADIQSLSQLKSKKSVIQKDGRISEAVHITNYLSGIGGM